MATNGEITGLIIGGLFGGLTMGLAMLFVVAFFVEMFAFREHQPTARSFWTTLIAWLITGSISAFILGNSDALSLTAFLFLLPAALIHFLWYRYRLQKRWAKSVENEVFE